MGNQPSSAGLGNSTYITMVLLIEYADRPTDLNPIEQRVESDVLVTNGFVKKD